MQTRTMRTALICLAFAAAVVVLCAVPLIMQSRVEGELQALPEAERHALYLRTLETLNTSCTQASGPVLSEYCREQAAFIHRFPDCDRDCHTVAERFAAEPSR